MKTLRVKVIGYDKVTNSLIVSFASDENAKDINEYPAIAYQPHALVDDESDVNKVIQVIAALGVEVAKQQYIQENFIVTKDKIERYSQLVGAEFEFSKEELDKVATGFNATNKQSLQTL